MGNESTLPYNDENIEWTDAVSHNGVPFQIGFSTANAASASETAVEGKQNFGIAVDWPQTGNVWTNTSPDVKAVAAISRYALGTNGGDTWTYILQFTNAEHYDYYFYDKTGDGYEVNTYRNGDHYVRYNSSNPTIAYIKGS